MSDIYGIGAAASAGASAGSAAVEAGRSWERQKKLAKNQISWRVQDLKNAGLNPLLAISGGLSGGAGRAPQAHSTDFARAMTEGMKAGAEKGLKSKQETVADAQARELRTRSEVNAESAIESQRRQTLLEVQATREAANATAAEYDLERARAEAALYEELGSAIPAGKFITPFLRMLAPRGSSIRPRGGKKQPTKGGK